MILSVNGIPFASLSEARRWAHQAGFDDDLRCPKCNGIKINVVLDYDNDGTGYFECWRLYECQHCGNQWEEE